MFDPAIKDYINKINQFPFVKTVSSCQGHFYKEKKKSIAFYTKSSDNKDEYYGFDSLSHKSKIKYPFVLLCFIDNAHRSYFLRLLRKMRREMPFRFIFLNPHTKHYSFRLTCYLVSYFDKVFISATMFIGHNKQIRYHKNRIKLNIYIKEYRDRLFGMIIDVLRFIQTQDVIL